MNLEPPRPAAADCPWTHVRAARIERTLRRRRLGVHPIGGPSLSRRRDVRPRRRLIVYRPDQSSIGSRRGPRSVAAANPSLEEDALVSRGSLCRPNVCMPGHRDAELRTFWLDQMDKYCDHGETPTSSWREHCEPLAPPYCRIIQCISRASAARAEANGDRS